MAIFKCKTCGAPLEIGDGALVAQCEYCGIQQTLPRLDDDRRANLYDRANHFRRNNDLVRGIKKIVKTDDTNPWTIFKTNYAVGDIVSVKIVSMMPFGALAEIVDGVDGLIHISQIAPFKIAKPADLLEIGQIVDAKIVEVNDEKQNVNLSIRAILEEAQAMFEAMP